MKYKIDGKMCPIAQHRNDFDSVQTIKHVDAMLKMMEVLTGDQRFTIKQ